MATVPYRFVVEMEFTTDVDGSTDTFYAGSSGYFTKSGDVPANTHIPGTLKSAGSLKRELFSGARITGSVRPSYGIITINNADGEYDAFVGYGTGGKVTVRWGPENGAYPGDYETVYIAYVFSIVADVSELQIRLRDRLQLLDKPIASQTFAGTGGVEGNGGVSKRKQFVSQDPGFIPPVLVDINKQMYFLQSTGDGGLRNEYLTAAYTDTALFAVLDGGVVITRAADYASEADLLATSPSAGEVRFWWGEDSTMAAGWKNGPVYFRVGSPPAYELRVLAAGYPNDEDFTRYGSVYGGFSSGVVALRAGIVAADLSGTDEMSIAQAFVDDETTYGQVLDNAGSIINSFYGFNRLDKWYSKILRDPESEDPYYGTFVAGASDPTTSLFTFNRHLFRDLRRIPVEGMESPIGDVTYNTGKTWPTQVAGAASDRVRDYLTRPQWYDTFGGRNDATFLAQPGALTATVQVNARAFPNSFSKQIAIERYFALFGGHRDFYTFTTPLRADLLALDLHDVVTLQINRFGLNAGKKFRIVNITINCGGVNQDPSLTFGVWGGTTGEYTGSELPGGGTTAFDDPYIIQAEDYSFLTTEDDFVLLIEGPDDYLQAENDAPIITESSTDALLQE